MHEFQTRSIFATMRRAAVLVVLSLLSAPALAQYIGGAAPPLPAPLRPGEVQTPAGALARAVRTLAQSPRDFNALITAGRAALDLGDTQAAIGFFGRAEEVRPSDPAPKIGMGAATVITGDASGALRWFFEAQRLGATSAALGADRGLAQDLLGNQSSAQVDYRAALRGREADEARRRLALSLGISGDRNGAFTVLQPLLMRRDSAAQRTRAFVLALVGDERGASSAIDQAMPGTGSRMAGFFRLLPTLSAPQKAAAVHLGVFPDPSQIRVAAVSPRAITPPPTRRATRSAPTTAEASPRPAFKPTPRVVVVDPVPRAATSGFNFNRPAPRARAVSPASDPTPLALPPPAPRPVLSSPQPSFSAAGSAVTSVPLEPSMADPFIEDGLTRQVAGTSLGVAESAQADAPTADAAPGKATDSGSTIVAMSGDRLSGIDRLLAQADELPVPPAPRPRFEKPAKLATVDLAKARKTADSKKKSAAVEELDESIGLAGTNWVQLAGGSRAERMGVEFRRLATKSAVLRKRSGAVTAGKDYFRLLTGPFATRTEAQTFVNQIAKDGIDGFSWTRAPAALRIEKLPSK